MSRGPSSGACGRIRCRTCALATCTCRKMRQRKQQLASVSCRIPVPFGVPHGPDQLRQASPPVYSRAKQLWDNSRPLWPSLHEQWSFLKVYGTLTQDLLKRFQICHLVTGEGFSLIRVLRLFTSQKEGRGSSPCKQSCMRAPVPMPIQYIPICLQEYRVLCPTFPTCISHLATTDKTWKNVHIAVQTQNCGNTAVSLSATFTASAGGIRSTGSRAPSHRQNRYHWNGYPPPASVGTIVQTSSKDGVFCMAFLSSSLSLSACGGFAGCRRQHAWHKHVREDNRPSAACHR